MSHEERNQRLLAEYERLKLLKTASDIFDFEPHRNPPERYMLLFRGRGLNRGLSSNAEIEFVEFHKVELRLPYSFPARPPDIRWLTPIFHPNISFSGFIHLKDVGLPWDRNLGLDVICERLWEMARLAYMDLDRATNYTARGWFAEQTELELPIDPRQLRKNEPPQGRNIIHYERRGDKIHLPPGRPGEVLFIGEDTPVPDLPVRIAPPRRIPRRPPPDDDDILYIGPE